MALMPPSTGTTAPPADLLAIAAETDGALRALLRDERRRAVAIDPDLDEPLACLERAVLTGGKRLRPAFARWGFVAGGGRPDGDAPGVRHVACAIELLHAFALVHDDVIDDADTRRGAPTPHVEFAARHDLADWRGRSDAFGRNMAVLVGDLAHSLAEREIQACPAEVRARWSDLQVELVLGQYLDVLHTATGRVTVEQARRIARLKSGRYTIVHPLQLGAASAGARDATRRTLAAYAEPLGLAFQLRDDLLGALGERAVTGKPVGDDLREGKPTVLLAEAYERTDAADRLALDLVGTDLDDEGVRAVQDVLVASGAAAAVESEIAALTDQAIDALDDPSVPPDAARGLIALAAYLADRAV